VEIIEPVVGELACGYEGIGKLAPLDEIIKRVLTRLA
jgi:phosphopantothenoylcysteine synthetase/decarboxylase